MCTSLRYIACLAALLSVISAAFAQFPSVNQPPAQTEESMKAKASPANIQAWLESKDPRLIAWGAYFARENNDAVALALLPQVLDQSVYEVGMESHAGGAAAREAVAEVLDTLIQRNRTVPVESLTYLSYVFPVQSIILASRLPITETSPLLMGWYLDPERHGTISRSAAMLLSKSPPSGFAGNMLANSEEKVFIMVVRPNRGGGLAGGVGAGTCGSYGISRTSVGLPWPRIYSYQLTENDNSGIDPVLVEAGGDRVAYERSTEHGFRTCGGLRNLTPETRHHLLAQMLGQRDEAVSWPTQKFVSITMESEEQVEREIGAAILRERATLLKSVEEFQGRGLLTAEEAQYVLPKLAVTIRFDSSLERPD